MKHHQQKRKLGRVRRRHSALLSGLARSLILVGRIKTTKAKAKELRPFIERLVTRAKSDTLQSRRIVASRLGNQKEVTRKIFTDIAPKYSARSGGYTRITGIGPRLGDAADMAVIEFV